MIAEKDQEAIANSNDFYMYDKTPDTPPLPPAQLLPLPMYTMYTLPSI